MRIFANLFLLLFFADGGLSLVDEILHVSTGTDALSFVRQAVAVAVMLWAIPLFFLLALNRRLPKQVFLPLIVFALWGGVGFWPLSEMVAYSGFPLLAAAGQLLLLLVVFSWLRRCNGGFLLSSKMLSGPWFSLRHTLKFCAVSLVLLPFFLIFLVLAAAGLYFEQQTAGFMRLTPPGIFMTERVYRQGDKTIRLAAMMHVGSEEYYRDLSDSVDPGRTIVLIEGVSDNDGLLQNPFDYGGVSEALGLVSQEVLEFDGRLISLDEFDQPGVDGGALPVPHILRADIDINRFDPQTVEFLNVVGKTLLNDNAAGSGLGAYHDWADEHMTADLMGTVMEDILFSRNRELVRILLLTIDKYDVVVIPWGALHMPAIEAAVLDQGFRLEEQCRRLSLDFRKLPFFSLLKRLAGSSGEG
jgi:hypothetical protein